MLAQARADVGIVVSRSNAGGVQAVQWSLPLPSAGASLAATAVAAATLATPAHAHGGFFLGLNFGIPFAAQDPIPVIDPDGPEPTPVIACVSMPMGSASAPPARY